MSYVIVYTDQNPDPKTYVYYINNTWINNKDRATKFNTYQQAENNLREYIRYYYQVEGCEWAIRENFLIEPDNMDNNQNYDRAMSVIQ